MLHVTQITGNVTATHLTYGGWQDVPNGTFEDDLTSWSTTVITDYPEIITLEVTATEYHDGSKSLKGVVNATNGREWNERECGAIWVHQTLNLTNVNNIRFWYKTPEASPGDGMFVWVAMFINPGDGPRMVWYDDQVVADWTQATVDISELRYSGDCIVSFVIEENPEE